MWLGKQSSISSIFFTKGEDLYVNSSCGRVLSGSCFLISSALQCSFLNGEGRSLLDFFKVRIYVFCRI